MSLFSSSPKNRKRRRVRSKRDSAWIDEENTVIEQPRRAKAKRNPKNASPQREMHKLNAQIGAIETFLAGHHQDAARKQAMRAENILPPPDRNVHRRTRRKMTLAARRRYLAERNRNGLGFLILFGMASAIAWWLIFSGI